MTFKIPFEPQMQWFCDLRVQDYVRGRRSFQSLWISFQLLGDHSAFPPELSVVWFSGSVRNSGPFMEQSGPSYICPQELCVLESSANWERDESRSFQDILYLGKKKNQSLLKRENVKLLSFILTVCVDARLSPESPSQPQYNYFSFLGILFLSHNHIRIWTFKCCQSPSTNYLCFTAARS